MEGLLMYVMPRFALFCCMAAILACAKSDDEVVSDTAAGMTTMPQPEAPAMISLADVAGKWQMRATPESGKDTSTTIYVLNATANTSDWSITFPNRPPVPMQVTTDGDSIMADAGPYQSVRRKGVQVTTHSVLRLQNGNLAGTTVARYTTSGPDSVLNLRAEGTRAP
ncbi:MAG: hypothetical protein ACR2G6_00825 [Gemmatimonadaceae bacterium]